MNKTDPPTDQLELPAEVTAELLCSRHRCLILITLAEQGDVAVVDLAARLAADAASEPAAVDESARDRMRQEIYDHHLPKLAATGVVKYDSALDKLRLLDFDAVRTAGQTLRE